MFRCEVTGQVSKPREPQRKLVVESRNTTYTNYKIDPDTLEEVRIDSTGWEIVKEINVSAEGLAQLQKEASNAF